MKLFTSGSCWPNRLIIEPWNEEEIAKATALRDAQFERDGVELEPLEEEEEE